MEISSMNPVIGERDRMMKKLMSYFFAAHDLALYLNTHPRDKKALAMHADMIHKLNETKAEFENQYGPLTANNCTDLDQWCWIEGPWPWQAD